MNDWVVILIAKSNPEPTGGFTTNHVRLPIVYLSASADDELSAVRACLQKYPTLDLDRVNVWVVPFSSVVRVWADRELRVSRERT